MKLITNKMKVESVQRGRLLKSWISVVQKVAAPKNGVEFAIGAIRCSVATLYEDIRHCTMSIHLWVVSKPILVIDFGLDQAPSWLISNKVEFRG